MTSETAATFASAFREHREAFGVSITIGTTAITAIVNESQFGRELMEGGFAQEGDIEVKYLIADLATAPVIGTAATYRDRSFRVSRVANQPGSLIGELSMRPAKR
jgi:hypothetical protein